MDPFMVESIAIASADRCVAGSKIKNMGLANTSVASSYGPDLDLPALESVRDPEFERMLAEWVPESQGRLIASTARSSQHNSSVSPEAGKTIYTPTSTQLGLQDDHISDRPGATPGHVSIDTEFSPVDHDFELLSSHSSAQNILFDLNRPPLSSQPASSTHHSQGHCSNQSSPLQQSDWSLAAAVSMESDDGRHRQHPDASSPADAEPELFSSSQPFNPLYSFTDGPEAFDPIDDVLNTQLDPNTHTNFLIPATQAFYPATTVDQTAWITPGIPLRQRAVPVLQAYHPGMSMSYDNITTFPGPAIHGIPVAQMSAIQPMYGNQWSVIPHYTGQPRPLQSQVNPSFTHSHPSLHQHSWPVQASSSNQPPPNPRHTGSNSPNSQDQVRPQPLAPASSDRRLSVLHNDSPSGTKSKKGGRKKDSKLSDVVRKMASNRRKTGACWRCVLQRDPCLGDTPCTRCQMRSHKGQLYYFDCDRSKLPDFVHDFLPASMTLMHQKQTIEDCVTKEVYAWNKSNPVDVFFTSGWGQPLKWRLFEFVPQTDELLLQFQYLHDPSTGQMIRHEKYSPPLGIIKIESDEAQFNQYLDELFTEDQLKDFSEMCFASEREVDNFQELLLDLLCGLYLQTQDWDLKDLLRKILRMLILTYIMGHTLTIVETTLSSVLQNISHSPKPHGIEQQEHISPRLANRQLKFYFAVLRLRIYEDILRWQQAILHSSAPKDSTWLPVFCVMLGFAMVLEEIQCTLQIQADAKAQKGEMTYEEAQDQAMYACERIDKRYKLLVGLFQCKYRSNKWTRTGSFGNKTPTLTGDAEVNFLTSLRSLLESKGM